MNRRLQRRDPRGGMTSLEAAVTSLLEDGLSFGRGAPGEQSTLRVDVMETASRFEIIASVPGLHPEDVDVTVLADSVRITSSGVPHRWAEDERESEDPEQRWLVRERYVGRKERTITLPSSVIVDDVTASFEDGVLRVVLPKADIAKARRIQVQSGTGPAPEAESALTAINEERSAGDA